MEHDLRSEEWYEDAFAAFREAVTLAKGQTPFANVCRCTQGNISQLIQRGSVLPERFVLKVEAATGISRHRLRPDIYPLSNGDAEPVENCGPILSGSATPVVCDRRDFSQRGAA